MNRIHDDTSQALLTAARRLLDEHGPEALTVRRIASEAGMSTMNVYSRFGGKDGVIDELYADGYRRLIAAIDAVPPSNDIIDELLAVADTYRRFATEHPTYYGIMFRSAVPNFSPSREAVQMALGGLSHLVARVRRGQDLGQVVADRDPQEIAAWLWASCHGMVSFELDEVASEHVSWPNIYLTGVRTALAGLHPSVVIDESR
jgi:AcrR family transcriptional regulator